MAKADVENIELCESGCCDGWSSMLKEVNGECPECETPTVDGEAAYGCNWSPFTCTTCGYRGCDDSC